MDQTVVPAATIPPNAPGGGQTAIETAEQQFQGSINTIAARLNVSSGPALVLAAVAHSAFVQKKELATRREITDEMKNATAYYRPSYQSNLSSYLSGLVKDGTLNEIRKGEYALSAGARTKLSETLATQ